MFVHVGLGVHTFIAAPRHRRPSCTRTSPQRL